MSQQVSTLGKQLRRWLELQAEDVSESAFAGFDDGAGVVGNQPAQQSGGVLGVTQVPGAVECMQARHGEVGRVADVVRPRGGFQQIGVSAENRRRAACPCGHASKVRPAAGEGFLEEYPGERFGPRGKRVHAGKARQPRRGAHGRGMPSEDVLFSVGSRHPVVVQASAAGLGAIRSSAGFRRHRGDLKGDDRGDLAAAVDGQSCIPSGVIFPIRGNLTGFRVQVPPRTHFRISSVKKPFAVACTLQGSALVFRDIHIVAGIVCSWVKDAAGDRPRHRRGARRHGLAGGCRADLRIMIRLPAAHGQQRGDGDRGEQQGQVADGHMEQPHRGGRGTRA